MNLLSQNSAVYQTLLVVHILCAIVGLGAVSLNGLYGAQIRKFTGTGPRAIAEANYRVSMVAENFIYATLFFGLLLAILGDGWSFTQVWIWLSLVLFVIALGVSHGVLMPAARRMNALLAEVETAGPPADGPPPQVAEMQALGKRLGASGAFLNLMMVVIVALMVFKPGA